MRGGRGATALPRNTTVVSGASPQGDSKWRGKEWVEWVEGVEGEEWVDNFYK